MLVVAGLLEAAFATALKLSEGLTRPAPTLAFFLFASISFYMLTRAARVLPLGTAYAVWTGIGAAGTVVAGILLFAEPVSPGRMIFLLMLIAAIAGLKLLGGREGQSPGVA